MAFAFQLAAWGLDAISRDERYTWMYMIAARRKTAAAKPVDEELRCAA
jgi:hypothetical protein